MSWWRGKDVLLLAIPVLKLSLEIIVPRKACLKINIRGEKMENNNLIELKNLGLKKKVTNKGPYCKCIVMTAVWAESLNFLMLAIGFYAENQYKCGWDSSMSPCSNSYSGMKNNYACFQILLPFPWNLWFTLMSSLSKGTIGLILRCSQPLQLHHPKGWISD